MRKSLRQRLERDKQRDCPELRHETDEEALVPFLGKPGPEL
jgi:hypothetical protein